MSVLARTSTERLEAYWSSLEAKPKIRLLRKPETGLVMIRARAGGDGMRFHLGEMTVTRCAAAAGDVVGHAWVAGRDHRRAELAAIFDAMLQQPERHEQVMRGLIDPEAARQSEARRAREAKAAATRVEFYTMVRGDE